VSPETDLRQFGDDLHQRLVAGDVTASAEIAEFFLTYITKRLQKRFPRLDDPHLVDSSAEDALLNYFDRPERFDPTKRSLGGYHCMSANGDLLNFLASQKERAKKHLSLGEDVELDSQEAEYVVEPQDEFDLERFVLARTSSVWQRLSELVTDPVDQEIVGLMLEGVRETDAYAEVLGISHVSTEEQSTIVKRHKDRLKKILLRGIKRSELTEDE
jgi:hypothetical protein